MEMEGSPMNVLAGAPRQLPGGEGALRKPRAQAVTAPPAPGLASGEEGECGQMLGTEWRNQPNMRVFSLTCLTKKHQIV